MCKLANKSITALLLSLLTAGCASQNAMTMIPQSLKLEIAADQNKLGYAKDKKVSVDTMLAKARGEKIAPLAKPELTLEVTTTESVAIADKSVVTGSTATKTPPNQSHRVSVPSIPIGAVNRPPNAITLFEEAMALRSQSGEENGASWNTADERGEAFDDVETETAQDQWKILLANHGRKTVVDKLEGGQPIEPVSIAALASKPVSYSAQLSYLGEALDRDSNLKVRLYKSRGSSAIRIAIGRISEHASFEALQIANERARKIIAISGGAPLVTYDPSLAIGTAVIQYGQTSTAGV